MKQWIGLFVCLVLWGMSQLAWAVPDAFVADLSKDLAITKTGASFLTGWEVKTTYPTTMQQGSAFDPATGVYTVPADGYYLISGSAVIKNGHNITTSNYFEFYVAINGLWSANRGLLAIQGSPKRVIFTMQVGGVVFLKKGMKISLAIISSADSSYTVMARSGFSCLFLSSQMTHGFHASMTGHKSIGVKGWTALSTTWKTTGEAVYKAGNGFNESTGVFVAPVDGTYYLGAQVRLDNCNSGEFAAQIVIGNRDSNSGLYAMGRHSPAGFSSIPLSGIVSLKKGERVQLHVYSQTDTAFIVNQRSSFSAALLNTPKNVGFHASASADKHTDLSTWHSNGRFSYPSPWAIAGATGLYESGTLLDSTKTQFVAPHTGLYYLSVLAQVTGFPSIPDNDVRLVPRVNRINLFKSGLQYSIFRPQRFRFTLHLGGLLFLEKGDKLQVSVFSSSFPPPTVNGFKYTLGAESSISARFMTHTDRDQDGISSEVDCNDSDDKVFPAFGGKPGAVEVCNKIDNNCNGKIDDLVETCQVAGVKGSCQPSVYSCDANGKKVCLQTVRSAIETCNGKDDNCDGLTDNVPGLGDACQSPTKKGACSAGTWQCVSNQKTCVTTVQPGTESCNGKDDDCDGKVDNVPDLGKACTDSNRKGECQAGTWICAGNQKLCQPLQVPTPEVCDGKDEDCDGQVDNIPLAGKPCKDLTLKGECQAGVWTCQGQSQICKSSVQPGTESCDGKDDDCDGKIDNVTGLGTACTDNARKGECQAGLWVCANNAKVCQQTIQPTVEVCDQKDNDCDGQVDNGVCGPEKPVTPPDAGPGPQGCGQGCPAGQLCLNNACQPHPCDGVTCKDGEFCRNGSCVLSCGCLQCAQGGSCVDGVCRSDLCAGVTCNQGEVCFPGTGACVADACAGVTCKAGEVCRDGSCTVPLCDLVQCGANQVCVSGQCYDKGCEPGTKPTLPTAAGPPTPPGAGCQVVMQPSLPLFPLLLLLLLPLGFRRRLLSPL